jgi:predicted O-methyltransferase YrrM
MDVERLIAEAPSFHTDAQGKTIHIGSDAEVLRFIAAEVRPGSATLETGIGQSTVLFAMTGAKHTCVAYAGREIERVRAYCAERSIDAGGVDFRQGRSEHVLPGLEPDPLDLVFIDGSHAFPAPFLDWVYAGRRLREGGVVIVDDTQLWTGRVLRDFLVEQPGWDLIQDIPYRTSMFRRTGDFGELVEWVDQPFVQRRSATGLRRLAARGLYLLRQGELGDTVRRQRARRG